MKKRLIITLIVLAALLLSLFATPSINGLTYNLFAAVLILTLLGGETRLAYIAALSGGFMVDVVAAHPFGTALITYPLGLAITRWLLRTRFTNRSLLAYLTLTVSGTLVIETLLVLISTIGQIADPRALSITLNQTWLISVAIALTRNFVVSVIVHSTFRLSGQRYATLAQREF